MLILARIIDIELLVHHVQIPRYDRRFAPVGLQLLQVVVEVVVPLVDPIVEPLEILAGVGHVDSHQREVLELHRDSPAFLSVFTACAEVIIDAQRLDLGENGGA